MRTATPISTCSRMTLCTPSATAGRSRRRGSSARMHDDRVRLGIAQLLLVEPAEAEIFPHARHKAAFMRSRCRRSIITTSAPARPSRMEVKTSTPSRSMPAGAAWTARRRAPARPSRVSSRMFERATRECSDVAADRHDEALEPPLVAADGQRVEQRLGRMLMRAVAGIDHGAVDLLREEATAPAAWWRTTRRSGCMAFSVIAVSISVSPFFTDEARDRHVHHVGAEPLAGELEGGWVRVEASKKRLICVRPRSVAFSSRPAG